ncbi:hypothetical protein EYF80_001462 [Liparis tanakae]|uniref:Uncharacterized protein n=1 Tax=Liparis tanakae TaxID=230148 RepID=A0A4Z2JDC6_9TELE|nr:hypothetical protein EYF80_001462 [Liparis tanakae]
MSCSSFLTPSDMQDLRFCGMFSTIFGFSSSASPTGTMSTPCLTTDFTQAEVGHLEDRRARLLRDEDVVWFQVSVDNVVLVQERDGAGHLEHKAVVGLLVGSPRQDKLVEVAALAELHDEPKTRQRPELLQGKLHVFRGVASQFLHGNFRTGLPGHRFVHHAVCAPSHLPQQAVTGRHDPAVQIVLLEEASVLLHVMAVFRVAYTQTPENIGLVSPGLLFAVGSCAPRLWPVFENLLYFFNHFANLVFVVPRHGPSVQDTLSSDMMLFSSRALWRTSCSCSLFSASCFSNSSLQPPLELLQGHLPPWGGRQRLTLAFVPALVRILQDNLKRLAGCSLVQALHLQGGSQPPRAPPPTVSPLSGSILEYFESSYTYCTPWWLGVVRISCGDPCPQVTHQESCPCPSMHLHHNCKTSQSHMNTSSCVSRELVSCGDIAAND